MVPINYTLNVDAANTTKVALGQQLASAGNLTLTAAAGTGLDSSGAARILLFTTTEDDSSKHFTVTGTDANGNVITEGPTTLPNSTTKASALAYATVTQIAIDAAIGANLSVGTTNTTSSAFGKLIALNYYNRVPHEVCVEVTGTINFTVKETFSPIMDSTVTANNAVMISPSALSSKTASTAAALDVGATGVQLIVNSYSTGATAVMRVIATSQGAS